MQNNFLNIVAFTPNFETKRKLPCNIWFDGSFLFKGLGYKIDKCFLDVKYPKDLILNVIIPAIISSQTTDLYLWDGKLTKYNLNEFISIARAI